MYGYMYNTLLSSFAYLATYVVVSVIQHSAGPLLAIILYSRTPSSLFYSLIQGYCQLALWCSWDSCTAMFRLKYVGRPPHNTLRVKFLSSQNVITLYGVGTSRIRYHVPSQLTVYHPSFIISGEVSRWWGCCSFVDVCCDSVKPIQLISLIGNALHTSYA